MKDHSREPALRLATFRKRRHGAITLCSALALVTSCSLRDTDYLQNGETASSGTAGVDASSGGDRAGGTNASGGAATGGTQPKAGSAATGGTGTSGTGTSSGCEGTQVKCESEAVIADFESNDGRLCVKDSGTIVTYGDGTGTTSPPIGDLKSYDASDDCDRGSAYALHVLVGGAKDYGFGVALRFPALVDAVAAEYTGIKFKAKTSGTAQKISVKVATPSTLDASFGGSCEPVKSPMKLCNDHPSASVVVAAGGWVEYKVEFASLKQEGWGVAAESNFAEVIQLHISFPGPISGGSANYDVWLDDFAFYK